MQHVNKKPLARKRVFSNTVINSTLKLEQQKFHAAKPLAFSLHLLFRRDQNDYSNLASKFMKMGEQMLRPLPNTIYLICKKPKESQ